MKYILKSLKSSKLSIIIRKFLKVIPIKATNSRYLETNAQALKLNTFCCVTYLSSLIFKVNFCGSCVLFYSDILLFSSMLRYIYFNIYLNKKYIGYLK